jgi:hypothetical protein
LKREILRGNLHQSTRDSQHCEEEADPQMPPMAQMNQELSCMAMISS